VRGGGEGGEEDLGLEGLFWLLPNPEDHSDTVPPSASAPDPRWSERVLSVAGYYAALAGKALEGPSVVDGHLLARAL